MIEKDIQVIETLIKEKIIPNQSVFQITEVHLTKFLQVYHNLFGNTDKAIGSRTNIKFARRLAGRSLLQLNIDRGAKHNTIESGILYLICNPAFPQFCKIGITIDLYKRLAQYQTYDPHRSFSVLKYNFVLNRKIAEKEIIEYSKVDIAKGEWVDKSKAISIFDKFY